MITAFRLKRTLFGRFVLQVQETRGHIIPSGNDFEEYSTNHWRRATLAEAVLVAEQCQIPLS